MRKTMWLAALALAAVLAGCASDPGKYPEGTRVTPARLAEVAEQEWQLAALRVDGKDVPLLEQGKPTLQIGKDLHVAGRATVNRYMGQMKLSEAGEVSWGPLASTMMAGPDEAMKQEQVFLAALAKTTRMHVGPAGLLLETPDHKTMLEFVPGDGEKKYRR
ncbi:MAG TPA: META domain-containing protein [Pelomicrobium sp.]|nr:META domain-containing protein [Pelomicrobium sp.]